MTELVCQIHGPYDASYGTCPYCSNTLRRPNAPTPLNEDNLPTDLGARPGSKPAAGWDSEGATDLGGARSSKKFLDDDVDPTELGRYGRGQRDDVTEIDNVVTGSLGILWVKDGPRRGQVYKIKDGTVVGRSTGSLVLDDPKVSNPHAKFTVEEEHFVIWDFGSRNGTFVKDKRIREATILDENDTIKIGEMVFVLKVLL
jgi:hypothetical protein